MMQTYRRRTSFEEGASSGGELPDEVWRAVVVPVVALDLER